MIALRTIGGTGYQKDYLGGVGLFWKPGYAKDFANKLPGDYSDLAKYIGPQLQQQGIKRLCLHSPGGHWSQYPWQDTKLVDGKEVAVTAAENRQRAAAQYGVEYIATRVMWPDQWLEAEKSTAHWANRRELRLCHDLLVRDYGVEEIIYYIGGLATVRYAVQKAALEPFHIEGASLALDHTITAADFDISEQSIKDFRKITGGRVYFEGNAETALPLKRLAKLVNGSICKLENGRLNPEKAAWAAEFGEVITIGDRAACPAGQTPMEYL